MDYKKLSMIIPMISVIVMIVWGFLGGWSKSWIAVAVGGVLAAICRVMDKDNKD